MKFRTLVPLMGCLGWLWLAGCGGSSAPGESCTDQIRNGSETDVDCGGGTCAACANGKACQAGTDCLSGTWANSVYEQGLLEPGDLEEATGAALAVGDFDVGNAQHHGTPTERRDALLAGFETGDPSVCQRFLPGGAGT